MKIYFSSLMEIIPRGALTIEDIYIASVSTKGEIHVTLHVSDQQKLRKVDREGEEDKFSFSRPTDNRGPIFKQYMIWIHV